MAASCPPRAHIGYSIPQSRERHHACTFHTKHIFPGPRTSRKRHTFLERQQVQRGELLAPLAPLALLALPALPGHCKSLDNFQRRSKNEQKHFTIACIRAVAAVTFLLKLRLRVRGRLGLGVGFRFGSGVTFV